MRQVIGWATISIYGAGKSRNTTSYHFLTGSKADFQTFCDKSYDTGFAEILIIDKNGGPKCKKCIKYLESLNSNKPINIRYAKDGSRVHPKHVNDCVMFYYRTGPLTRGALVQALAERLSAEEIHNAIKQAKR